MSLKEIQELLNGVEEVVLSTQVEEMLLRDISSFDMAAEIVANSNIDVRIIYAAYSLGIQKGTNAFKNCLLTGMKYNENKRNSPATVTKITDQ